MLSDWVGPRKRALCSERARKHRELQNFNQLFELTFWEDSASVYAGEVEVRPPGD
jgi:hypothetical protein